MTDFTLIPDAAARAQALLADKSCIVQAPAGSGKTTLLATRYVTLLKQVQRPEEILAITFTKKAAAEMRHRVLKMLAEDTPLAAAVMARDKAKGWQLQSNPNALKIQTIDSFALDIASQVPSITHAAGLSITERAQSIYALAANSLFSRLYSDEPSNPLIAQFLGFLDNDVGKAVRLISFMLARRDQWLEPVKAVALAASSEQTAGLLAQAIRYIRQVLTEQLSEAIQTDDEQMVKRLADAWGIPANWDAVFPRLLTAKDGLRKRLTVKEGISDNDLKRIGKSWLEALDERGLAPLIIAYTKLPEALITGAESSEQTKTLANLQLSCVCLSLAAVELEQIMRDRAQIDFTGILLAAKAALRDEQGPTDLALFLDYQICHMLVDEYQDTSRAQYEFFSMLIEGWQQNDGKTFFAVGDPMQSIYRFRDADVSIFNDSITTGIASTALTHCQLQANFRSSPAVVTWCNELFSSVFAGGKAASLGEVPFSAAVAMTNPELDDQIEPIASWIFSEPEAETAFLVDAISQRLALDPDASIAILCRARNHVAPLLRQLKIAGIPLLASDMDQLAQRGVVRDLMNLYRILFNPSDRLAWYCVLRSPMFGLTLTQLSDIDSHLMLPDQLELLSTETPCISRLILAWDWVTQKLYEVPLREVLEGFWYRCGGLAAYDEHERQHAHAWFELLDDLGSSAYESKLLTDALGSLFAQSDQSALVQVMTIHKSKGLEFDHVFIPYLHHTTRPDDPQLLQWRDGIPGLLMGVSGDQVHDWLKFEERARASNEEKRMLYVACTRAIKSLVTSFSCEDGKNATGLAKWVQPYASSFPTEKEPTEIQTMATRAVAVDVSTRKLRHISADYRWISPTAQSSGALSSVVPETLETPAQDPLDTRQEVQLGLLVHKALQWLSQPQATALREQLCQNFEANLLLNRMERWLTNLKLPVSRQSELIQQACVHVGNTLQHERGRWVLQPHDSAHSEWSLTGVVDDRVFTAILDRSFIADGQRWVIDYKTGSPRADESVASFMQQEKYRYKLQLGKYKNLLSELEPVAVRTALYFTALAHFEEIQMD